MVRAPAGAVDTRFVETCADGRHKRLRANDLRLA